MANSKSTHASVSVGLDKQETIVLLSQVDAKREWHLLAIVGSKLKKGSLFSNLVNML